jgi:pimeloyl-ACP methyl ester carboxylesterase
MQIAVSTTVPIGGTPRPPVLLIHGAANSASVWIFWQHKLAELGWASYAIDLRGHGKSAPMSLARTSMTDYIADVESVVGQLARQPVIMGWSMGAVIAMMVAGRGGVVACVALEASPLSRTVNPDAELREGEYGHDEYGITTLDPDNQPMMPDLDHEERLIALASLGRESRYARDERRRAGIVVESMPCPLLIANGPHRRREDPEGWKNFWLKAEFLEPQKGSHWGLVLNRRLLASLVPQAAGWLERRVMAQWATTK